MKKCPYCAEEIQDEAIKCKHCQSKIRMEQKETTDTSLEKKKRNKTGWALGILGIMAFFIIRLLVMSGTHSVVSNVSTSSLTESDLIRLADDLNKDLPKNVDEMTLLTKTSFSDGIFTYSYKLLTRPDEKYTQSDLDRELKDVAIKKICSVGTTKNILTSGHEIVYEYYDNDNNFVGKITMKATDCN